MIRRRRRREGRAHGKSRDVDYIAACMLNSGIVNPPLCCLRTTPVEWNHKQRSMPHPSYSSKRATGFNVDQGCQ